MILLNNRLLYKRFLVYVIDLFVIHHRRAKGGDKDSQRVVNEEIEKHRALLSKADMAKGVGDNQEDEEQNVSSD